MGMTLGTPPPKINMSPKKGAISNGNFIFQPSIFRGWLLVFKRCIVYLSAIFSLHDFHVPQSLPTYSCHTLRMCFSFSIKSGMGCGQLLRMGRLKLDIYVDHIFNMISLATCQYSLKHYPIHPNTSWECVCWYVLGGLNTEPQEVGLDV